MHLSVPKIHISFTNSSIFLLFHFSFYIFICNNSSVSIGSWYITNIAVFSFSFSITITLRPIHLFVPDSHLLSSWNKLLNGYICVTSSRPLYVPFLRSLYLTILTIYMFLSFYLFRIYIYHNFYVFYFMSVQYSQSSLFRIFLHRTARFRYSQFRVLWIFSWHSMVYGNFCISLPRSLIYNNRNRHHLFVRGGEMMDNFLCRHQSAVRNGDDTITISFLKYPDGAQTNLCMIILDVFVLCTLYNTKVCNTSIRIAHYGRLSA